MSSEHPLEEAELQRPVGYTCLNCDGWGCRRCLPVGGEQDLDVDELREIALRGRVRALEARIAAAAAELELHPPNAASPCLLCRVAGVLAGQAVKS